MALCPCPSCGRWVKEYAGRTFSCESGRCALTESERLQLPTSFVCAPCRRTICSDCASAPAAAAAGAPPPPQQQQGKGKGKGEAAAAPPQAKKRTAPNETSAGGAYLDAAAPGAKAGKRQTPPAAAEKENGRTNKKMKKKQQQLGQAGNRLAARVETAAPPPPPPPPVPVSDPPVPAPEEKEVVEDIFSSWQPTQLLVLQGPRLVWCITDHHGTLAAADPSGSMQLRKNAEFRDGRLAMPEDLEHGPVVLALKVGVGKIRPQQNVISEVERLLNGLGMRMPSEQELDAWLGKVVAIIRIRSSAHKYNEPDAWEAIGRWTNDVDKYKVANLLCADDVLPLEPVDCKGDELRVMGGMTKAPIDRKRHPILRRALDRAIAKALDKRLGFSWRMNFAEYHMSGR